jgi:hypothetical protein
MKTIALTTIFLMLNSALFATVCRVNNRIGANADFTSLTDAHNAASIGDTIYVEGSPSAYTIFSITKPLTIIGAGYFLNENPDTQVENFVSNINSPISFNAGSQGSKIMGCYISNSITINTGDITVERNIFIGSAFINSGTSIGNNITIINNYFANGGPSFTSLALNSGAGTGRVIANNYFRGTIVISSTQLNNALLNNIFAGFSVTINNAIHSNNIQTDGTFAQTNSIFTHNIGHSTQYGTADGNQQNVTMSNVFVGLTGNSTDGQWQLKPGSPAIGAGQGGVDCGIFGGNYPYVLSGMPPIPSVFEFDSNSLPVNTLNVTISAKAHE